MKERTDRTWRRQFACRSRFYATRLWHCDFAVMREHARANKSILFFPIVWHISLSFFRIHLLNPILLSLYVIIFIIIFGVIVPYLFLTFKYLYIYVYIIIYVYINIYLHMYIFFIILMHACTCLFFPLNISYFSEIWRAENIWVLDIFFFYLMLTFYFLSRIINFPHFIIFNFIYIIVHIIFLTLLFMFYTLREFYFYRILFSSL